MKGVVFEEFGQPDVLRLAEVPMPELRPSDLLVRVKAAGVNRADLLQRQGFYGRQNFGDSPLLGLELAGEVVEIGAEVSDFVIGDRVMAITGGGAYAEYARVDHAMALRIPESLGFIDASAIMESFVTAYEVAGHLAAVSPGQAVLVTAAAGGVGSAVVQVAQSLGGRVMATANAARRSDVLSLGADLVVDYRAGDHSEAISSFTEGRGLDVVIDFIGGDTFARNLQSLRAGGTLVQVGLMAGAAPTEIPLDLLLHNHLKVIGTVMKSRETAAKRAMIQRFATHALPLFDADRLRPLVSETFAMAEVAQAHQSMERGGGFGKIVLVTDA